MGRTAAATPLPPPVDGVANELGSHWPAFLWASSRATLVPRTAARRVFLVLLVALLAAELAWYTPMSLVLALPLAALGLVAVVAGVGFLHWRAVPRPRVRRYLYTDRSVTLAISASRRARIWRVCDHVKLAPEAPAAELRRRVIAGVAPAIREHGIRVELTAVSPTLEQRYADDFAAAGLELVPVARTRWMARIIGTRMTCEA